ncbi:MAG: hypothetical protein VB093_02725 [Propionicimonas sp.]|nr:hypothetical protein [Propionicimonas sp.]
MAWLTLGADPPDPTLATDANRAECVPIAEAPAQDLTFDHTQILRDGVERTGAKLEYTTTIATAFWDATPTLPDLRRVYQAVWDTEIGPHNFRRGEDG